MATTDGSATGTRTWSQGETSVGCPLCERQVDGRMDVYRHLMVNHRKSELSRRLVERCDIVSAGQQGQQPAPFDTEP